VFFSLCYVALRWILQLAVLRVRSNDFKDLEIVVPRHQLAILRRRSRRPTMAWADRLCLTAAGRLLSGHTCGSPKLRPSGDVIAD
jgi:hypothetical protein